MPLRNEVLSLEDLTKFKIYEFLLENIKSITEKGYEWRMLFIESLPGSIRADILNYGCSKWKKSCFDDTKLIDIHEWMPLSIVLFDKGIDYLPSIPINLKMDLPLFETFASYLWIHRPNIKKLHISITNNYIFDDDCNVKDFANSLSFGMDIIQKYFDEGLASKLVELLLFNHCNDAMLKSIGFHANCLKILDVWGSHNITADGINGLIFKGNIHQSNVSKFNTRQNLYEFLGQIVAKRNALNMICFTLQELCLDNVFVDNTQWIVILSCIKNLAYIGWEARNITESVMTVWHKVLKPAKLFHLSLAHLTVSEISYNEMYKIFECLPCLKEVVLKSISFAGLKYNADHTIFWNELHKLNLILNSSLMGDFESFCKIGYTQNLTELIIEMEFVEDGYMFDFSLLQRNFPSLKVLLMFLINDSPIYSYRIHLDPKRKFQFLNKIVIKSPPTELKSWLLFHGCPALNDLKIIDEKDIGYWENILSDPPPLVRKQLQRLEIRNYNIFFDNERQIRAVHHSLITEFIKKCSNLKEFGCVETFGIHKRDVEKILNDFIRFNNYSLKIVSIM